MLHADDLMHLDLAPFRRAGLALSLDEFERLVMDAVAQVLPELDDAGRALVAGLHLVAPHWADAHPVEVAQWFTQPHADLEGPGDDPVSPRAFLLAGGNPRIVAALAEEFDDG